MIEAERIETKIVARAHANAKIGAEKIISVIVAFEEELAHGDAERIEVEMQAAEEKADLTYLRVLFFWRDLLVRV